MFGVEIAGEVVGGAVALGVVVIGVFIALASWALINIVKLAGIVAALEAQYKERSEDHERRLLDLERRPFSHS